MKFRVLCGVHSEGGRTYEAGSVVNSKSDLSRLNYPGVERFERLPDGDLPKSDPAEVAAAAQAGYDTANEMQSKKDSLDGMTVEELRKFAEGKEVDLGKARTREQILAVLRSA